MPTTATIPATAAELSTLVEPFGPSVEGAELVFATDPPAEWLPVLRVLHTGIRAALSGRRWYGCGSARKTAAPILLDPAEPIPAGITLLCVAGDDRWDRIRADAWIDHPDLFAP